MEVLQSKKSFRLFTLMFLSILANIIVVIFTLTMSNHVIAELNNVTENRYNSYLLADELRQSSDDLTRYAHIFASTGNSNFEKHYWTVAAIRDGKEPRPAGYNRIYWNFIDAGIEPAQSLPSRTIPLLELMREKGFSEQEFALLAQAKSRSDKLIELEIKSMNAAKGIFQDRSGNYTIQGKPNMRQADSLVNTPQYFAEKAQIMEPINEFITVLDQRTTSAVSEARSKTLAVLILSFILFTLSSVFTLLIGFLLQKAVNTATRQITAEVDELTVVRSELEDHKQNLEELVKIRTLELEKTDAMYRLITDNIRDVVSVIDVPTMKFTYVSPSVERLRGYSPEEVMSQPVEAALTVESQKIMHETLAREIALRATTQEEHCTTITEVEQPCRDGSIIPTEVVSEIIFDKNNIPLSVIGVSRNISDRKEDQRELINRTVELEELNGFMIGREERVIELKEEVNQLCLDQGREIRYPEEWK